MIKIVEENVNFVIHRIGMQRTNEQHREQLAIKVRKETPLATIQPQKIQPKPKQGRESDQAKQFIRKINCVEVSENHFP